MKKFCTMKKFLLGTVALVAFAAPAAAADLAARPYTKAPAMIAAVYDWSGFYIGANGGWGSSHNCYTNTAVFGVAVAPTAEGCHDAAGGTAVFTRQAFERRFRDIHTVAQQLQGRDDHFENVGKFLLDLPPDTTFL